MFYMKRYKLIQGKNNIYYLIICEFCDGNQREHLGILGEGC